MERPTTLQLHAPRVTLTDRLNDHLVKRFAFCQEHPLHVTVDHSDRPDGSYEIRAKLAPTGSEPLVARAVASDVFATVDLCADKLRQQLSRLHDRRVRHHPRRG
jgi:ribosome-associated translation inhibitor RaiA